MLGMACAFVLGAVATRAEEIRPANMRGASTTVGDYSPRTLVAAIIVDRDGARLGSFTVKDRPFTRELFVPVPKGREAGATSVQLEVALLGPDARRYTQRIVTEGLCLDHPAEADPHIAGDTIALHRESVIVELPEIDGFDHLEVSFYTPGREGAESLVRVPLGTMALTAERFDPAGGSASFGSLAFVHEAATTGRTSSSSKDPGSSMDAGARGSASASAAGAGARNTGAGSATGTTSTSSGPISGGTRLPEPAPAPDAAGSAPSVSIDSGSLSAAAGISDLTAPLTSGVVHWPEEYGDPDKYLVYGDATELSKRINIVLVPDGYTYAEKATMQQHAQTMVNYFRGKTPYKEHDRFINYILVYAYSTDSGTDQCDCSIVKDTPMNTRFLNTHQPQSCGHSDNRCLFYGNASGICDPSTSMANINAAELRAPAWDKTVVMVNTTRYGGCGGARAVYSAGNGVAADIAAHELGHSLAHLGDEYVSYSGCGTDAGGVNTSLNGVDGAWPEWIADLGAPRQGAQYYSSCVYRPYDQCDMQVLNVPFCAVCNQQWALTFFGHYRVSPTAPISSASPGFYPTTQVGLPVTFSVSTRLASGPLIKNDMTWAVQGPGDPGPVVVETGTSTHIHSFPAEGSYSLTCEVIADTNFVKPQRTGPNRDLNTWTVDVVAVPEVSDESAHWTTVTKNPGGGVDIRFESTGSSRYNLYVSNDPRTLPFKVLDPSTGRTQCHLAGVTPAGGGMNQVTGVNLDQGIAGSTDHLFFLVTADNGAGTEGPLGFTSAGTARSADAYCSH